MTATLAPALGRIQASLTDGEFADAEAACRRLLARGNAHPDVRYLLGLALALSDRPSEAVDQWALSLQERPRHVPTLLNLGIALSGLGKHSAAIERLRAAVALDPFAPAQLALGNALLAAGRADEALGPLTEACRRDPRSAQAHNNLGVACRRSNRLAEARAAFHAARTLDPTLADAWNNEASVLELSGELRPALEGFEQALSADPALVEALLGRCRCLEQLGRAADAVALLQQASATEGAAAIHHLLANMLHRQGHIEAALASYERAIASAHPAASSLLLRERGHALESLHRLEEAQRAFRDASAIDPSDPLVRADLLSVSARLCDWDTVEAAFGQLEREHRLDALHPFVSLSVCERAADQLAIARAYAKRLPVLTRPPVSAPGEVLRVAYLSSDLRDHPVGHLIACVLEQHDPTRVQAHAVGLAGAPPGDVIAARIRAAATTYHDMTALPDDTACEALRSQRFDIIVDLNGYTVGARPRLLALRPAPLQVGFLGYAGTCGADYLDYLIADAAALPPAIADGFSEQIIRLPHCLLPVDPLRATGGTASREQWQLPAHSLVLAALANPYKISRNLFSCWLRLLAASPDSVLWLRQMGAGPQGRLRQAASERGIDASRLIFAPYEADAARYLARLSLADLALDTYPFGAHSSACDALVAGVPLLTCRGHTFASRIAASALAAAGLPELVGDSLTDYEQIAQSLIASPAALAAVRDRLRAARASAPLYDLNGYVRALESAFTAMAARQRAGIGPGPIDVGAV